MASSDPQANPAGGGPAQPAASAGQPDYAAQLRPEGGPGADRRCLLCARELAAGESLTAVLVELPGRRGDERGRFERLNYCADCWPDSPWAGGGRLLDEGQSAHPADAYGAAPVAVWAARVPPLEKPQRKVFVDDSVLTNFFLRLADRDEPENVRFRFVLMLILLRHKKLRHERTERGGEGGDAWLVRLSPAMAQAVGVPSEQVHRVPDPRLGPAQVQQVAEQLGQILHQDLDAAEEDAP